MTSVVVPAVGIPPTVVRQAACRRCCKALASGSSFRSAILPFMTRLRQPRRTAAPSGLRLSASVVCRLLRPRHVGQNGFTPVGWRDLKFAHTDFTAKPAKQYVYMVV